MRFCLVTQHHLCNNPRLVKEADTLTAAGHDVRVVWLDARADLRARDDELLATRRWRATPVAAERVGLRGQIGWLWDGVRREAARRMHDAGLRIRRLAEESLERRPRALERAVRAAPADVVVAHTLGALPPAARAARALGARVVFDAEDLHVGELPDDAAHAGARARVAEVERYYLPRCDRVVASSDGIADALRQAYGLVRPRVVLNAFALPPLRSDGAARSGEPARLYWFSQVVGPDRGIQTALDAMALLGDGTEIYLRGEARPELMRELRSHATALGLDERVHLLPIVSPDELPALSAQFDVGLALETGSSENRALCVTNKLLTYLAAGLAVAATDTPGQRGVMEQAPAAGFLFPAGDAVALAAGLRALVSDPARLASAKQASRAAAEQRFSWEHERERLLEALTNWAE
ncbi:MAG: glycosyltransferase family 4 protein [Gemmatimonadaceae bacterium]|nr:glycosyltransferase family 4 protein [Gemmatimonadaceae bacterium]